MAINTLRYIEQALKIKDKHSRIIPLVLNQPQRKLYDALADQYRAGKPMRAIILKARQMGFSTITEAILFKRTATAFNVHSAVVSHDRKATNDLLSMFKLYYHQLPDELKPATLFSNAKQVVFDDRDGRGLRSQIDCLTAGGDNIGRGATYHNLHLSELAWWQGDVAGTLLGLMQAVPHDRNSLIVIESTANGYNVFKKMWDAAVAGENEFVPVFCAWWEMAEYRLPYDGFALDVEEQDLQKKYGLDNEQLAWRRWCLLNNCGGDRRSFAQEYPSCPEEAFLTSGACIFETAHVLNRLQAAVCPVKTGTFCNGVLRPGQDVKIYEDVKPGYPYVIGADTAGEGSDWSVAQVLDNTSGRQVCTMRMHVDEGIFAKALFDLGMYYNCALLAVEANFSTYPIRELERLGYTNQYVRQKEDTYTHAVLKSYGFKTTAITRPVILANLVDIVRENPHLLCDRDTLLEMLVFCKNSLGRAQALSGEHDDCVLALAIAYACREQQRFTLSPAAACRQAWTQDMLEDYAAAGPQARAALRKKWGEPL